MYKRELITSDNHSFFLFGPRQTGKSTLLNERFDTQTSYFYNLLQNEEYIRLKAHPEQLRHEVNARSSQIKTIIIDEIQRIPTLLNEIHDLIQKHPDIQFVLTGSSARKLKTEQANLLAGRALSYNFHPLTIRELPKNISLSDCLRYGTLPSIVKESSEQTKHLILKSYVETYLKEEIEAEARLKKLDSFIQFLNLAAFENGNTLNFSNIARETASSPKTIQSYFQLLQDTLVGFFLHPFHKSKRKRLSKKPKFYFFDTGVVRSLQKKVKAPLTEKTQEFGDAFEHYIILEMMRINDYFQKDWSFSYFQTESGTEVDLIIETPTSEMIAIEIKSTQNITNKHLKGLKLFVEEFPQAKAYCVSTVSRPQKINDISILPWKSFLNDLLKMN